MGIRVSGLGLRELGGRALLTFDFCLSFGGEKQGKSQKAKVHRSRVPNRDPRIPSPGFRDPNPELYWGYPVQHGMIESNSGRTVHPLPFAPCGVLSSAAPAVLLAIALAAGARAASLQAVKIPLTVDKGVPLRVQLVNRVPIKLVGVPVDGRLASPVYVFDRQVLPAGCEVLGRVTSVHGVSKWTRARAIMGGNFTPYRVAQVEFDTLILKDGKRLPIATSVSQGELAVVHLESGAGGKKPKNDPISKAIGQARQQFEAKKSQAIWEVKSPGKVHRLREWLKARLIAYLPYHRQAYPPGTIFTARLKAPIALGSEMVSQHKLTGIGSPPPPDSIVHARLLTALDSATARRGMPVSAVITQPLFSSKHLLIVPQGSMLNGRVVEARAARMLHRNGKLRFTFQRLTPPAAAQVQVVHASVQGLAAPSAAHLRLDAEGGVSPIQSKKRFIAPAISVMVAAWTSTPDRDAVSNSASTVPGQGGGLGQVLAGGGGFGLLGSVVTLASRSYVVSGVFGFYGAAWSVYSHLLSRGQNVVFPANTPMEIRFGSHHHPARTSPGPTASSPPAHA